MFQLQAQLPVILNGAPEGIALAQGRMVAWMCPCGHPFPLVWDLLRIGTGGGTVACDACGRAFALSPGTDPWSDDLFVSERTAAPQLVADSVR